MKIEWENDGGNWYGKGGKIRKYQIEGKWAEASISETCTVNLGWGPTIQHLKQRCQALENYYANGGKVKDY